MLVRVCFHVKVMFPPHVYSTSCTTSVRAAVSSYRDELWRLLWIEGALLRKMFSESWES